MRTRRDEKCCLKITLKFFGNRREISHYLQPNVSYVKKKICLQSPFCISLKFLTNGVLFFVVGGGRLKEK